MPAYNRYRQSRSEKGFALTEDELAAHPATKALRDVLIDLTMVSHVDGASYDASGGGEKRTGGERPPGGPDRKGDREDGYRQKSAGHFVARFGRLRRACARGRGREAELLEILTDARQALQDWRKAPSPERPRPEDLTEYHKAQIAADVRSARTVASEWGVSHVTVLRYRRRYSNPVRLRREAGVRGEET